MESGAGDERPTLRPALASSWDAAGTALAHSLHLHRADRGARDADWEELLAPPAPGQDVLVLKRSPQARGEKPCFLYVSCAPTAGGEIVSLGVLSSARNMEVYLGDEYCGTSRGKVAGHRLQDSETEIIFYKKYLKLESSTHACKIKLLSFGEKQCVFLGKVVIHVKPVSADPCPSAPALGSRIDLERVRTIMESMGSKLSPGAQQLMHMVRVQQQNCAPAGEQLQSVLGRAASKRVMGLQPASLSALDTSSSAPFPLGPGPASANLAEEARALLDGRAQPPGGGQGPSPGECALAPQGRALLEDALRSAASSFSPKRASDDRNGPDSDWLPFLQNLCSQVNHLRVGRDAPRQGPAAVPMDESPLCSYLEKMLCRNLELMEKRLTGYIDQRLSRLQEHLDSQIALLVGEAQSPGSPPAPLPLRHCGSGERLSNGER